MVAGREWMWLAAFVVAQAHLVLIVFVARGRQGGVVPIACPIGLLVASIGDGYLVLAMFAASID